MGQGDKRYGIVFCGGGAKGAYQIGVWKYLRELGLSKEITGVSGASIGAINSLLFAQGDWELAEKMWLQARQGDVAAPKVRKERTLREKAAGAAKTGAPLLAGLAVSKGRRLWQGVGAAARLAGFAAVSAPFVLSQTNMVVSITASRLVKLVTQGQFSQDGLRRMIGACIDPTKVETVLREDMEIYTALTKVTGPHLPQKDRGTDPAMAWLKSMVKVLAKVEYWPWRAQSYEKVVEMVLASAALPIAYPMAALEDGIYIDGGVLDNTPAAPLADGGFRNIIAVHLDHLPEKKRQRKETSLREAYGEVTFCHIWPSDSKILGDVLTITPELTRQRMELGYEDAKEQLFQL